VGVGILRLPGTLAGALGDAHLVIVFWILGGPRFALALTSAAAMAMVLSGTFEQIVALAAVTFLVCYVSAYAALFVLRRREPALPRPYRAFGFPFSTAVLLTGCLAILIAAVLEDPQSGSAAALLLIGCAGVCAWVARRRRLRAAKAAAARI